MSGDNEVTVFVYGHPRHGRTTLMTSKPLRLLLPTTEETEDACQQWLVRDDVREALEDLRRSSSSEPS